jgi:hypothetical protein
MWNKIALEELDENTNKSTKFFFNKRTKWKYEQKYQILVESLAGLGFGERICHNHLTEKYPILSYANNKQVTAARPILAKFRNITRTINP